MKIHLLGVALAALVPLNAGASTLVPPNAGASTAFVADQAGHAVAAVDLRSGRMRSVALPVAPHNVEACGRRVFAVGMDASMSGDMHGMAMPGRIVEIDPQTRAAARSAEVGEHPAHVVCDAGARRAFVTLADEDAVAVVDLATLRVMRKIPVGKHPHGLRMSRDGRWLFVANAEGKSLSVVDLRTLEEKARISLPGDPVQVAPDPAGRFVYATLGAQNEVVAVDLAAKAATRRLSVGRTPVQLGITPDGSRLVVANQGTREHPDDRAAIVDTRTMTVTGWVRVGAGAHGVAIDRSGRYAYVTCEYAGTIAAIDIARRRLVATYPAGSDPNGVTLVP